MLYLELVNRRVESRFRSLRKPRCPHTLGRFRRNSRRLTFSFSPYVTDCGISGHMALQAMQTSVSGLLASGYTNRQRGWTKLNLFVHERASARHP